MCHQQRRIEMAIIFILKYSNQENPRGCLVFLRFYFSVNSNHRIFCWAEVGKTPENPRFSCPPEGHFETGPEGAD